MQIHTPCRRLKAILLLVVACVLVSSCTSLSIVNKSSQSVQVRILISPFDGGKLTTLPPGGEDFELSPIGGFFHAEVVSGTELVDAMTALKNKLEADLKKTNLDAVDITLIMEQLDTARKLVAVAAAAQSIDSCSGLVPDFGSATGTIVDSADGGTEFSSCAIEQPSTEGNPFP